MEPAASCPEFTVRRLALPVLGQQRIALYLDVLLLFYLYPVLSLPGTKILTRHQIVLWFCQC